MQSLGRRVDKGGAGEGAVNCQSKQQKLEQRKEKFHLFSTWGAEKVCGTKKKKRHKQQKATGESRAIIITTETWRISVI